MKTTKVTAANRSNKSLFEQIELYKSEPFKA